MKGIYDWIEYMNRTQPHQAFWDPSFHIRKQIDQTLASMSAKDSDPQRPLADAEWVGKTFEEELDKVRDDERRQFRARYGPPARFWHRCRYRVLKYSAIELVDNSHRRVDRKSLRFDIALLPHLLAESPSCSFVRAALASD